MLTATYTIVAMSVEQANVRSSLNSFYQLVRGTFRHEDFLSPPQADYACEAMQRLYDAMCCRKVELYLIPALRRLTRVADRLLDELEQLRQAAAGTLAALVERLRTRPADGAEEVSAFCGDAEAFCGVLFARLDREEEQLFPLARVALPSEAWFAIAHQIMAREPGAAAPAHGPGLEGTGLPPADAMRPGTARPPAGTGVTLN
ncbi:MAG: hypothetical protein ACXU8N_07550 [Telluria sp.]